VEVVVGAAVVVEEVVDGVPVVTVVRVVPVVLVVVPVVRVVSLSGVLFGDACACAGTTIASTTGLIHLEGIRMVAVRPPTVNIWRTRRRVVSLIEIPPGDAPYSEQRFSIAVKARRPHRASQEKPSACDSAPTRPASLAL